MPTRKKRQKLLTNKTCKQITALIFDYVNDTLSPKIKHDFELHLRICPDCVHFLNTYKRTLSVTGSIRPQEIPPAVRDSILDFLRRQARQSDANS